MIQLIMDNGISWHLGTCRPAYTRFITFAIVMVLNIIYKANFMVANWYANPK
jgi:hypothetical protein